MYNTVVRARLIYLMFIQVVPSSKVTWEIPVSLMHLTVLHFPCVLYGLSTASFNSFPQEFLIQVPDSDSDDGHDESESEQESGGSRGTKVPHRPPTMDEIDSVLGQFRRDAEVRH